MSVTMTNASQKHKTVIPSLRFAGAARLLFLLLWLTPAAGRAQDYSYTTNDDRTITITAYTGSDGAVTLPDTIAGLPVTGIADYAFFNCGSLTNVTIPEGVTNLGGFAFQACTNLTAIAVAALNPVYGSVDGVLFDQATNTLIQCPEGKTGSYTIPDSVTHIGDYAFFGCAGLTGVTMGNRVTRIGVSAFASCFSLGRVTIPDSVTSLGDWVFSNCDSLTNVTIPDGVTGIGGYAFIFCGNLAGVTLGNHVASIGDYAFFGCGSLTGITIDNRVTSIGDGAFYGCGSLTNVTIPNGVTSLGSAAFGYCTSLAGLYFLGNAPGVDASVFYGDSLTVYYLPGTTGWDDFARLTSLPTMTWYLPSPMILDFGSGFGVQPNGFSFIISWATNLSVVVEGCTNLANAVWQPIQTNTLIGGSCYFSDPQWTNDPVRCYRLRSP